MDTVKTSGAGTLYNANGFLVPVLEGTTFEMGRQYGELMVEAMQQVWDVIVQPEVDAGILNDAEIERWRQRAYDFGSVRTRFWFDGIAEGSGWSTGKVCMVDQVFEFLIFQSKIHSFSGCTSLAAWGGESVDGNMYIGRNLDWGPDFNKFPQVLVVRKPTDGSYKSANMTWPGISCATTMLNEKGVYFDVHDGTSMGGSLIYLDRPSIMNVSQDILNEVPTKDALIARINGINYTFSMINMVADENSAASVECSTLGGNRLRPATGESYITVNTYLGETWGLGKRETVSNSLRRYSNMADRMAEKSGQVNSQVMRDLFDLRLFNEDGSFAENGGCTKPTKQDADLTNHQTVTDVANRKIWMKIPVPDYYADWTEVDLKALWA